MFSFSISMSSTSEMRFSRSAGSKISSNSCFSSIESCRLAAIVSLSRPMSSSRTRGRNRLLVQRLAQLHVLLKQRRDALHGRFHLRRDLRRVAVHPHRRHIEAIGLGHLQNARPLNALHQNLDVAVRHLQALHDVDDAADLVNLVRLGFIHTGIVLGGEEDPLVSRKRLFQGAHARLAAHHEGRHHERKDDDIPDRHHRQLAGFEFLFDQAHSASLPLWPAEFAL